MGHALKEIWRVLVPEGHLIDLRPLVGNSLIEVVSKGQVHYIGLVDETGDRPDTIAANAAVNQVVREGWFTRERKEVFKFAIYWDNIAEMKAYAKEKWTYSRLPEEVMAEAQQLMANSEAGVKIRVRYDMLIARYQKHFPTKKRF